METAAKMTNMLPKIREQIQFILGLIYYKLIWERKDMKKFYEFTPLMGCWELYLFWEKLFIGWYPTSKDYDFSLDIGFIQIGALFISWKEED